MGKCIIMGMKKNGRRISAEMESLIRRIRVEKRLGMDTFRDGSRV
jgi:hypothetical protein